MKRILTHLAALTLLATAPAFAQTADEISAENIANACAAETNIPGAICECVGETAVKRLDPNARLYLLALISDDKAAAEAIAPDVSVDGKIAASMFMVTVPSQCAG